MLWEIERLVLDWHYIGWLVKDWQVGPRLASNWYRIGFLMTYWWSEPELTLDWAPVCLELTSDRHRIGTGLVTDRHDIGSGRMGCPLFVDWPQIGIVSALHWKWIGNQLKQDWQLSVVRKLCCPESSLLRIVLVPLTKRGSVTRIGVRSACFVPMGMIWVYLSKVWEICKG